MGFWMLVYPRIASMDLDDSCTIDLNSAMAR
jgi:hypothetical protein